MKKFFNTFKEELIALPLFALCIYGYHSFMANFFPESAQFDLVSEMETVIWTLIKLVIFTTSAWIAMRVVFPNQFRFMVNDYLNNYNNMTDVQKRNQYSVTFFAFLIVMALIS